MNDVVYFDINEFIKSFTEARQKAGMTQKELSDATGIAQGDISRIEKGIANPSLRTLKRLADGMGMKLNLVFTHVNS